MRFKQVSAVLAAILAFSFVSTACGGGNAVDTITTQPPASESAVADGTPASTEVTWEEAYTLDPATEGELTVMMWSGDDSFLQDVGHKEYAPEELFGQNGAAAYATAHEFNKIYPNIKINIFAMSGEPNKDGIPWAQHRENFAAEYGVYPDMYATTDVSGDISKGLIADLSVYKEDPVYKTFNPSIMKMMEYDGRQFALPQYMIPWGIFINKSLAEANNIDIPEPNWNIDEYTEFTAHSEPEVYYGAMDSSQEVLRTATKGFVYSLINRSESDPYVNFNTDEIKKMVDYAAQWVQDSIWPQWDAHNISEEWMVGSGDWWGFNYFKNGKLLTLAGDPWMMGDCAHTDPNHWGRAQFDDWDIYPRPSSEWQPNHVGVVLDPFVIRNYAMDDGDPTLNDNEKKKLDIAWEFAKFWCADTRAWQARADQQFSDGGNLKTSLNDSFPLVTGAEFDKQMAIWYGTPTHQRFADKELMPGFQYVLELWQDGNLWDVSSKSYPWFFDFEGSPRSIVYEWENFRQPDVSGAMGTDANWADQVKAHLADWNNQFNSRWAEAFVKVQEGLAKYYK